MSQAAVSSWEGGKKPVAAENAVRLREVLAPYLLPEDAPSPAEAAT